MLNRLLVLIVSRYRITKRQNVNLPTEIEPPNLDQCLVNRKEVLTLVRFAGTFTSCGMLQQMMKKSCC